MTVLIKVELTASNFLRSLFVIKQRIIKPKDKYMEKLQRYTVFNNEEKERTERKILMIHIEQVKRFHLNK